MAIANSIRCADNRTLSVNLNGNTPLIGEVWNVTPALDSDAPFCVTITTGITEPTSAYLLDTQYIDCYDCLSNNYGVVTVTDCVDKTPFLLTLESFGSLPSVGDV